MLFKMSLRNIKRSIKDYAIYFFTLIIGVSIFYVFNAIGSQASMLQLKKSQYEIVELLQSTLSATSVFVAVILALLIVYASRFLMKRRHREFAVYMTLGMSKGQVSVILFVETVLIGIISLVVGLLVGTALSQLMSAVVVDMFEADMSAYHFSFSLDAARKTVLYFLIMYVAVIILNNVAVTRMKLIDLIQSAKKTERIPNRNHWICLLVFALSVAGLVYAYYTVGWNYETLGQTQLFVCILLGAVATFFIFWSVSGIALKVIQSLKNRYHKGINVFTFRQISSMINTMVFAMTVICLMLFLTICAISSSFAVRNSMNNNMIEMCPADLELHLGNLDFSKEAESEEYGDTFTSLSDLYEKKGYNLTEGMSDYLDFYTYADPTFTWQESFGDFLQLEDGAAVQIHLDMSALEEIITVSDYNRLMKFYNKEEISLDENEYAVICDFQNMMDIRNSVLSTGRVINIYGTKLQPKYNQCIEGFISLGASHINTGVFVVPDSVVEGHAPQMNYLIGNYDASSKAEREKIEELQYSRYETIWNDLETTSHSVSYYYIDTKQHIEEGAVGLGAILAFLGLYIGLVFLVSCGAILSLKCLSESVDSVERYHVLRKIGVDEWDISKSIFCQIGIFFLAPLALAIIHSAVGMKFATYILETFGTEAMHQSIGTSAVILLMIYGGYFLITYFSSKNTVS